MKVYKYRGIERKILKRDLNTFSNNQFFAPKFEMLNDPFEANFDEIISNTFDILKQIFPIETDNIKSQLNEIINFKHKLGILSLSKTCYSEQMWAYYASSNEGYCIEYDLGKLKDKTRNFDFSNQIQVKYSDNIPILSLEDIYNDLIFQKMYGIKKKKWIHEEEIRLIFDNSSLKSHHESAITGIYFGYNSKDTLINTFKKAFKNRNVKFYKILANKSKNTLESYLIYESRKKSQIDINKYEYEILKYQDNVTVENYYIYLKDNLSRNDLESFVLAFRENICYKPSNLHIFDSFEISNLIEVEPLKGEDYIKFADAYIAVSYLSINEDENIIFDYPYKDFYYKEQLKELSQK